MIKKSRFNNLLGFIFIFDCVVLPVIKIAGLSFKSSYVISLVCLVLYCVDLLKGTKRLDSSTRKTALMLFGFMALICFGELYAVLLFDVNVTEKFLKILIGCFLMVGSLYFGYICHVDIWNSAFWCFVFNVIINCTLALLGRSAPSLLLKIYSISVDTFIDGYYRNGGIIGNPNSSLLIMNLILMAVVLLYSFDKIKLSNFKIAMLYVLSIACDIIVSSRGELLHTIFILSYLTYHFIKKNNDFIKFLAKMCGVVIIVILALFTFKNALINKFPNIEISLERMLSLESLFSTSDEDALLSSIERPLYKLNVFAERFQYSPVWGSGIDGEGNISAFVKGTTGYHNDIFMILGAAGIIGFLLWFGIIKKAVRQIGIVVLSPFLISALSNTFLQSYAATMIYFFVIGYCYRNCHKEVNVKNTAGYYINPCSVDKIPLDKTENV